MFCFINVANSIEEEEEDEEQLTERERELQLELKKLKKKNRKLKAKNTKYKESQGILSPKAMREFKDKEEEINSLNKIIEEKQRLIESRNKRIEELELENNNKGTQIQIFKQSESKMNKDLSMKLEKEKQREGEWENERNELLNKIKELNSGMEKNKKNSNKERMDEMKERGEMNEWMNRCNELKQLNRVYTIQIEELKNDNAVLRNREMVIEHINIDNKQFIDELNEKKQKNKPLTNTEKQLLTLIEGYQQLKDELTVLNNEFSMNNEMFLLSKEAWYESNTVLQQLLLAKEREIELINQKINKENNNNESEDLIKVERDLFEKELNTARIRLLTAEETEKSLQIKCNQLNNEMNRLKTELLSIKKENNQLKEQVGKTGIALKTIANDHFELKQFIRTGSIIKKNNNNNNNTIEDSTPTKK